MTRKFLPIAALAAAALLPLSAQAEQHIVLKSEKIEFPATGKMFPKGPNVDTVNGNCVACHSIDMVFNQPNMSKAGWEVEVNKMRNVYKAPIDQKDVAPIVEYLTAVKGTK
jgi:mono/diheme cytochrome c family protein